MNDYNEETSPATNGCQGQALAFGRLTVVLLSVTEGIITCVMPSGAIVRLGRASWEIVDGMILAINRPKF